MAEQASAGAATCWCGGAPVEPSVPQYAACDSCGTLCSLGGRSPQELYGDSGLYQASYWDSHMDELGYPSLELRQSSDLGERALHWLSAIWGMHRPPARVLEVGCGSGAFSYLLHRLGYSVVANDVAKEICAQVTERFGVRTVPGAVPEAPVAANGPYDMICSFDVLEHLPDPLATLQALRGMLAPGGALLMQTPRHRGQSVEWYAEHSVYTSHVFKADEHLFIFTERSIRLLLERAGFGPLEIEQGLFSYDMQVVAAVDALPSSRPGWAELCDLSRFPADPVSFPPVLQDRLRDLAVADPMVAGAVQRWTEFRRLAADRELVTRRSAVADSLRPEVESLTAARSEDAAALARLRDELSASAARQSHLEASLSAERARSQQLRASDRGEGGVGHPAGQFGRSLIGSIRRRLRRNPDREPVRLLVDATKLDAEGQRDGVARYVSALLNALADGVGDAHLEDISVRYEGRQGSLTLFFAARPRGLRRAFRRWRHHGLRRLAFVELGWLVLRACTAVIGRPRAAWWWRRMSSMRTRPFDVVHATVPHFAPELQAMGASLVMTVYDCTTRLFPQWHTEANVRVESAGLELLARADAVLAISECTARDVARLYGLPLERISVVPLAVDSALCAPGSVDAGHPTGPELRSRYGIATDRYVLTVATIEPRKNLTGLMAGFARWRARGTAADVSLVIVGAEGWGSLGGRRSAEQVVWAGFVPDRDLRWLMAGAESFAYVSHYEGFGLPVLEAMACGAPVIYANNSSLPEVAGEAGVPIAPDDPEALADAFEALAADAGYRAERAAAGVARASEFTWAETAERTLDAIRRCAAELK